MVNSGNFQTAFARVVVSFDPALLKLTSEVDTNPNLSTVIDKTGMSEANTIGKIVIVVATGPSDTAPSGSFELASFNIDAKTSGVNSSTLSFDKSDFQIVDKSGPQLTANFSDASVVINGTTLACTRGELGNLDCSTDGCIDTADFELFNQDFGKTTSELNTPSGNFSPDLVSDAGNMIDTADYEILRSNFGSCQ